MDHNRRNLYGISTNGSFAIIVWYPTAPRAGQRPARWFEEVVARDTSSASCRTRSSTNAVWFQISDTVHTSFANDVVFTSYPQATSREAVRTINAYALSFLNKWLKGQDEHLHEAASPKFPRVINFRKK